MGEAAQERAIPEQEKGKHTRLEKGTRTTSNVHSAEPQQNLSGSEGKVQRPGRARPRAGAAAPPATLTQPKQATPSTTSSVKRNEAARPSGSCLGTWTVSQPKPPLAERERPGLTRRARGTKPAASCRPGPGSQEIHAFRTHYTRSQVGGKGQEENRKGRRLREKEAGLDQLPSPFPSPSPEVGCPTLPKVLCWVTAGRG